MEWKTKETRLEFQTSKGEKVELRIDELQSLEETIDALFEELERTGNGALLEELSPYFGCVWPSALGLTQYLLRTGVEQQGAVSILEVGCGLALPSLALSKVIRLSKILAMDFHPEVEKFFLRNAKRNEIDPKRLSYRSLDWRKPEVDLGRFGLVMGSDILYEKQHPSDLSDALIRWVRPGGRIVIADPARPYLQSFIDEMRARGLGAEPQIEKTPDREIVILDFKWL